MYPLLGAIAVAVAMCVSAPHALEAVAQGGVGSGSGAAAHNLAVDAKLTQQAAQAAAQGVVIQQLQTQLSNTQTELQTLKTDLTNLLGNFTQLSNTVSNTGSSGMKISGYEIKWAKAAHMHAGATATCSPGKKVLSGGCITNCVAYSSFGGGDGESFGQPISLASPVSSQISPNVTTFSCGCPIGYSTSVPEAYAICANVE